MRVPDKVIRKAIEKQFRFRGRDCVCLTKQEYQRKIDAILYEIGRYRYTRELLDTYTEYIQSKVAWIPEDSEDVQPRRESAIVAKPDKTPKKGGLELMIADAVKTARARKRREKLALEEKWGERLRRLNASLKRIEEKERQTNGE